MLITVAFNELELTAMVKRIVDDRLSEILSGMLGRALKEEAQDIDLVKATEVKNKTPKTNPAPAPSTAYKKKKKGKKFFSQSDRREMCWLIANTKMSKAQIAGRYKITPRMLAPCHFKTSPPWAAAKLAPKRPAWYKG